MAIARSPSGRSLSLPEIILFDHAHGLTNGVRRFAERLRAGDHHVTLLDLFDGRRSARSRRAWSTPRPSASMGSWLEARLGSPGVPPDLVYGGFSLGVLPAQKLAQHRAGAKAVLLDEGGVPLSTFGGIWPGGVPLQIHAKDHDEWSEVEALQDLAVAVPGAELHLYPGSDHLFTDASLPDHDADVTDLIVERTLRLLSRLG